MTQYFDFVALGWIEKYLREEMSAALRSLQCYEREPDKPQHLQEALRNVHSSTGVLRLCALDPAAMLTAEIERVVASMISGDIAGEARKLAMTELVAAIESLPAYLANVRAKREVSAGVIANIINDLRHFGSRPALPDSLFFNPALEPGAGISQGQSPAEDAELREFANRAMQVCYKYSKPALGRDHEALKRLYAVGKHATPMLAGSALEPYFRCYMGLIEVLAQPSASSDEVIVDIFKHVFVTLKSLAHRGHEAIAQANPLPTIKKMLYYIAKAPAPTSLQQTLRDTFAVHDVDEVRIESSGRLIQEDDLLEALSHTMSQLLEVMEFINAENQNICSSNADLVNVIVPRLRQVSIQLKAIGLATHSETIAQQHQVLEALSLYSEPAPQSELLDFGGALVAVKESLEHKLKHGLSAHGDSADHDLDAAVMTQTARCLSDMKGSINREFTRRELLEFVELTEIADKVSPAQLRPLLRAASLVDSKEIQQITQCWEQGDLPEMSELRTVAAELLQAIPEHAYAEQAVADMQQVLSVLGLMEDKNRESEILGLCADYIRDSIARGGLVNDAGMACFAEAIAALEQYMERRTEDPLGNSDEHLERARARAQMLGGFVQERGEATAENANVLSFEILAADDEAEELLLVDAFSDGELPEEPEGLASELAAAGPDVEVDMDKATDTEEVSVPVLSLVPSAEAAEDAAGIAWRAALAAWQRLAIDRDCDAPLENPDVDIDEELVECLVEESRKYIRRLQEALPRFAADHANDEVILEIRAIFHTMKGSARTIELLEFGEFMYDMEKVFNALRDGYISGSSELVDLLEAVAARMPTFIELMQERVPLYTRDFQVPHEIAAAITEKRFDPAVFQVIADIEVADVEANTETEAEAEIGADAESQVAAHEVEDGDAESLVTAFASAPPASDHQKIVPARQEELSIVWARHGAAEIRVRVLDLLAIHGARVGNESREARSSLLLRALVPALVELRDGGFLDLDEDTVGYFLDLPVVEQLASNAVFGLVDNGKGEFFKFPLSEPVIEGLQNYLDTLVDMGEGRDGERTRRLHDGVREFIAHALSLPHQEPVAAAPENAIAVGDLERFEIEAPTAQEPIVPEPIAQDPIAQDPVSQDPVAQESTAQESTAQESTAQESTAQESTAQESTAQERTAEEPAQQESAAYPSREPRLPQEDTSRPKFILEPEPELAPESAPAEEFGIVEDIDLELLDLFIETLDEYQDSIDAAIARLQEQDVAAVQVLKNTLHTVKGGANSVGVRNFGALVHDFETLIEELEHRQEITTDQGLEQIYTGVGQLQEASLFLRRQRADWDPEANSVLDAQEEEPFIDSLVVDDSPEPEPLQRVDSLRVATRKVDRLLDTGLEISMSNVRSRRALDSAQQDLQEVQGLSRRVQDLVDKLTLQLDTEIQARTEATPQGEQFDPLEMDRMTEKQGLAAILREAAFDLHEQSREMGEHVGTATRETVSSARLVEASQSELRLLRLVNFSKLGPGFRRLVHQVSRQLDKQVEFEISCDDGGLDVGVFEQVKTALEHMLRNAIDHGIDTPEERSKRGKSETGKITLEIHRQASEFVIQLLDDGNGLDSERIKVRAIEAGLLGEKDDISDEDALRLIFHSGLSTADKVTGISGRGVGMDVVHQSIAQVGGTVDVQSKPGFFTQFDIRIPASIMVNGALLARIGEEDVAIPLTSLDGSDFRHRDEIHREGKRDTATIPFRGEEYQLRYLGTIRGTLPTPKIDSMPEFVPVLFAHHGRRRIAFYVDAVANAEELVIRSLGAQFTGVPGVAGGSLKSDGQPVLALDLNELIRQADYSEELMSSPSSDGESSVVILCVDDSVMMRRTYEKRLRSLGYEVVTAVDGEEALDYLSETTRLPDFIFTDLEMPNMNGFDFIANLRRAPVLEDIPTVVVSSRDGEKHRDEARRVGATDFMAKGANSAEGMRAVIERHLSATALAS